MVKADKKDKKILGVLNNNGRASVTEVARKTGLPRDSVHYRIQRLIKLKVIKFFHAVINPLELGYPIFTYVTISLHNVDGKKEAEFYSFVKKIKNVVYCAKTIGKFDCLIAISAKSIEQIDKISKKIRNKYGHEIKDFEVSSIIEEVKYDYMVDLID